MLVFLLPFHYQWTPIQSAFLSLHGILNTDSFSITLRHSIFFLSHIPSYFIFHPFCKSFSRFLKLTFDSQFIKQDCILLGNPEWEMYVDVKTKCVNGLWQSLTAGLYTKGRGCFKYIQEWILLWGVSVTQGSNTMEAAWSSAFYAIKFVLYSPYKLHYNNVYWCNFYCINKSLNKYSNINR